MDLNKLKVGDVFYGVQEKNLVLHRGKIRTVIDGVEWFRYETPSKALELSEYKVLGILQKNLDGEWDDSAAPYDMETEFYIEKKVLPDGTYQKFVTDLLYGVVNHFIDKSEAEQYIQEKEAEIEEMDRK